VGFVCELVTWPTWGLLVVDSRTPSTTTRVVSQVADADWSKQAFAVPEVGLMDAGWGRTCLGFSGLSFVERQRPSADRRALLLSIGRFSRATIRPSMRSRCT
jgi:hypothetical protein